MTTRLVLVCALFALLIAVFVMVDKREPPATEATLSVEAKPTSISSPASLIEAAISEQLSQAVSLEIRDRRQIDNWLFISGAPRTINGEEIDYSQTAFAEDIAEGYFDDNFLALLKTDNVNSASSWTLLTLSLGATDAPFAGWPELFGAPVELFD